jgi:uncharacterized protein YbjT (DUF2867 family)
MNRILVVGGTGLLGRPVTRQLQADGFMVRLLARDLDKVRAIFDQPIEIVAGDVTDTGSLERALTDCAGVHLSVGGAIDQLSAENVAAVAKRSGLQRITYISGSTVFDQNRWFPMTQQKLMAEKAIRDCGVPYTIFCPTWPMEMLPRFVRDGRATLVGDQLTPWHWLAADDLGRMVSAAYQRKTTVNKRLFIHGPQAVTMQDAVKRYCEVLYPEIETVSVMPVAMALTVAETTGNTLLRFFAELMAYFDKVGELGDRAEANALLGAPRITLDDWLKQQQSQLVEAGVSS